MKPDLLKIKVITLFALLTGSLSSANAQSIDMSGTVSYSLVSSSTVKLKVARIQNYRGLGSASGTLVLQGWASKSKYSGGTIVGYKLAQVTLGRLNGGYYWANINENVSFTLPPLSQKGLFYMTMILAEYTGSGYATLDYVSMGTEILNILPPEINTSSRVSGTKNTHLSHKVNVLADSSFAVKFSASGLPPGLSINSSSGVISGTPQSFGTYNATITATNIAGTDVDIIAFDIAEGAKTPVINNSSSYSIKNEEPFTLQITASRDPSWYEAPGIPPGLNLNPNTGAISGSPNKAGSYQVTFKAYNGEGVGQKNISFTVNKNIPVIKGMPLISGITGQNVNYKIEATDNPTTYNAQYLPTGLIVNSSTGTITGTPTESGMFKVTLWAQNSVGTSSKTIQVVILDSSKLKQADFKATSTSFGMEQTAFKDSLGNDYMYYFTTYDGNQNKSPFIVYVGDGTQNSSLLISQEARLVGGTKYTYEFDYILHSLGDNEVNYGEIIANIPSNDLNSDGIPDFLDIDSTVNLSIGGKLYNDDPFVIDNFAGVMTRNKGEHRGDYTINTANGEASGNWLVIVVAGSIRYQKSENNHMIIDGFSKGTGDRKGIVSANTEFEIINKDQVRLPAVAFTSLEEGQPIKTGTTGTAILNRNKNKYIGKLILEDGLSDTHWPDYTEYILVITDTNDSDGDGIPDLSDTQANPLVFSSHPQSQTINEVTSTITLSATATPQNQVTYQWFKNGAKLPGETASSISVTGPSNNLVGDYYVEAISSSGTVKSETATILLLQNPPTIVEQPQSITVDDGGQLKLQLAANGQNLKYQWFKNGAKIDGATESDYMILEAHTEDAGDYYAVITNPSGEAISSTALVQVLEPKEDPPVIVIQPQSATVKKGSLVEFDVNANGDNLNYQWFKDGSIVDGATESTYLIFAAYPVDAGSYFVKITNPGGEVVSDTAVLQVTVEIVTAFTKVVRSTGEVALKYKISPPHYYQIQSASTPAFTSYEVLAQQNSTGLMENIVVQNDNTEGARFFRISLTEPQYEKPTIVTEPASKTVESGNAARFQVVVQSDTVASYKWFKNGEVIVGQIDSSLVIPVASVGDAGDYTVEVTNKGGSIVSGVANLDVKAGEGPPVITQQPTRLLLARNQSGTLSVEVSGTKPFEYQWYKYKTKIDGATQNIYRIKNADPSQHSGFYKVEIKNKYGSVFSERVLVFVE
jgi:hypothetical protein